MIASDLALDKILLEIAEITDLLALDNKQICYLGKKGLLTQQLKNISQLPQEQRQQTGLLLNKAKKKIEIAIDEQKIILKQRLSARALRNADIDVTLPGRGTGLGRLHPVTQIRVRLENYFEKQGFILAEGPEIEEDFYNFTALNIPEKHPARASHDTFYFPDGRLLRTHTSPVQIRVLQSQKPPVKIIALGKVYRCDSDVTHTPMFHQIEGLVIDKVNGEINFGHLKNLIQDFLRSFFEKTAETLPVRFRPAYFPFTEPSAEVDMGCVVCAQKGCRICKNTGWLEVLGCGMVHPNVFNNVNIDPEKYIGYAFGMGIDRLTMLYYGITDLRLLFESDLKFLKQF